MKYDLFLDDIRVPNEVFAYTNADIYLLDNWVIVRKYNEFVECIKKNGIPETISFDHDLADIHYNYQNVIDYDGYTEKTGYDCAKWLIYYCLDNDLDLPTTILIHSMNIVGVENIKSLFNTYKKIYKNSNH